MTITVNIHQAKMQLSKLLAHAQTGEEIVITKSGKPWAKLVPIRDNPPRCPGIASGAVTDAFFEPLPDEDLAPW